MKVYLLSGDSAILKQLGKNLADHRINQNFTQARLADESGISKRTLERMESGESIQFISLIRVLRALGMIENLNALIPELGPSPIQLIDSKGSMRKRASSVNANQAAEKQWKWGDDK